jgi:hypothetical protein
MASRLPAPLPILAAAAGAAGFAASRVLHPTSGPTPAQTAQGAPSSGDSSLAGSTGGDIWSQFGGDSNAWGDSGTGPGTVPSPSQLPPDTGPAPAPAPAPAPSHTYPSTIGAPPSGAAGWVGCNNLQRLWNLSGGILHPQSGSFNFSAWVGVNVLYRISSGTGTFTFRKILSGSHRGQFIHASDAGVTFHVYP